MTDFDNLAAMFFAQARRYGERPRYRYHHGGGWHDVSWNTCAERVRAMAGGLLSLGLQPGERVALLSATRPEWTEFDLAVLAAGGVTVPIYQSNLAHECGYIVANSESAIVCVENGAQLAKIREMQREGFDLDGVHHRVTVRQLLSIDETGAADVLTLARLMERGRALPEVTLSASLRRVAGDQLATIVYTSGTTGPPKGVMQTHGNHLAAVDMVARTRMVREGDVDFFFLPLAHSFARLIEYLGLYQGTVTAFARSLDTLLDDMRATAPNLVPSVPRIYEKIFSRVQGGRAASAPIKRRLIDWAFAAGARRSRAQRAGQPVAPLLAAQLRLAHRLVFSKLHALLGGRIKFLVSGGAPIAPEILEFFHAAGLLILEGYGLTETTPILTVNRFDKFKFGTVGVALDGVSLRVAADGEILAKGPNIALGYYKRPEATREAWDAGGWFHTGDIGALDGDGFLRITDRKKDLIKTSGGKYVAPQVIENLLKTQAHVSQAVVVGDRRKYCTALLTLDYDEVAGWAAQQGMTLPADRAAWASDPRVCALIDAEVAAANRQLASYESIKYYRILPHDLSVESGELTPSLKVKRKVVSERYGGLIEEMY